MEQKKDLKLVVTIVRVENTENVINAFRQTGVDGWSIARGRGTSLRGYKELFGLRIEPEKEIIFTLVSGEAAEKVMKAAAEAGGLDEPGHGLSLIIDVENAMGQLLHA